MISSGDIEEPTPSTAMVEPDAHGQAALLLTESLIHMLVASGGLTNTQAVEVLQVAAEVKLEVATAAGESDKRMRESLVLLARMQTSLESDQPGPQRRIEAR